MTIVKKIKRERIATAIIDLSNQSNNYAPQESHSLTQVQGSWLQAGQSLSLSPQLGCVQSSLSKPQGHLSLIVTPFICLYKCMDFDYNLGKFHLYNS